MRVFKLLRIYKPYKHNGITRMASAKTCILRSLKNEKQTITLPHDEVIFLGRNSETSITDLFLSRKQIKVKADYNNYEVLAEVIGSNYSGCNGYALLKGHKYHLKHDYLLELRLGEHQYRIVFDPPPNSLENKTGDENIEPKAKKPKVNYPLFEFSKKRDAKPENGNVDGNWEEIDKKVLIFTPTNYEPGTKIAAIDLDGTLIRPKSGGEFPKHKDDWEIWNPIILKKFNQLQEDGYKIVVFTNQAAIKQDRNKIGEFKEKIADILQKIGLNIPVFASTEKGTVYRKPAPGMWDLFLKKNANTDIDYTKSFYVGDAAGRPKNWAPKKKKDHSQADRLFAENIGLKFYTPEEFFLGAKPVEHVQPQFDPKGVFSSKSELPSFSKDQEVIVMVGFPGAGKSHFCKTHLVPKGYIYANRDTLGSWQKCVKLMEEALQNKQSVVVDNTNPDVESRKRYIDIAKKFKVHCRCFIINVSINHAKHNNKFREIIDNCVKVTDVIINSYNKNYQEPSVDEGFNEVVRVNFVPEFKDSEKEKLYKMYLLEN